jgi:hypothetical protein
MEKKLPVNKQISHPLWNHSSNQRENGLKTLFVYKVLVIKITH